MLVEKSRGYQRHGRVINEPQFRGETKCDQRQEHDDMKPLRQPQTLSDPKPNDQRA